jgi:hypothetical protein
VSRNAVSLAIINTIADDHVRKFSTTKNDREAGSFC